MQQYTYRYTWIRDGKIQISYFDAASRVDADKEFEETFAADPTKATVTRL